MTTWTDAIKASREQMKKNCGHPFCDTLRIREDYAVFDVVVCKDCDEILEETIIDESKEYFDVD